MSVSMGRHGLALALAIAAGACSVPMSQLLRDMPSNSAAPPINIATCPAAVSKLEVAADLAKERERTETALSYHVVRNIHDVDAVGRNISFMLQGNGLHPALQNEPVVRELFRAIGTTVYQTHQKIVQLAINNGAASVARQTALSGRDDLVQNWIQTQQQNLAVPLNGLADVANTPPRDLYASDFTSFVTTVRQVLLEASASNGSNNVATAGPAPATFAQAFVFYYQAYFNGTYVDRFGSSLAKPTTLQTISDNEISGTVQVLLELLMDYYVQTPVWYSGKGPGSYSYLPGNGSDPKTTPTVYTASQPPKTGGGGGVNLPLNFLALDDGSNGKACGITKLKAQAIQYIAQQLGNSAGTLGGAVGGSFGGINIGLGVLGKFSFGDNKTIHSLMTTVLQSTVKRAAEQASYRTFDVIPDGEFTTVADLVQAFLNVQLGGTPSSSN